MKNIQLITIATFAAAALSACTTATPALEAHSDTFGHANKANMTAQFVPPTAEQKANTYIPADSNRRALAKERYRRDEVEEPARIGTMN